MKALAMGSVPATVYRKELLINERDITERKVD
jgi:hypothetical protein